MLAKHYAYRFATQLQGVPIKFLEAMHFDIPKSSDERFKNIRTLSCQIQDRLEDTQLADFVRDIELLKERQHTNTNSLKCAIFKLFNQCISLINLDCVLDLVPLVLKVNLQELHPEYFQDEFDRIDTEIKNEYSCFVYNRAFLFQPQTKSLTDFIQYKRKHQRVQQEEPQVPEFITQIDNELIHNLQPVYEIEEEPESIQTKLTLAKHQRMLGKQCKPKIEEEIKTSICLKQSQQDNPKESQRVCIYGLPYILEQQFKDNLTQYLEQRFGKISAVDFVEYSKFKNQVEEEDTSVSTEFKMLNGTKKLLERVKKNKNRKLYKSYAIIKFDEMESKIKCLSQDLRLFGIKFQDMIIRIDDSDHKRLLYVNNLSKHSTVNNFISFLNENLGSEFEPLDERQTLQNSMACLIMKSFDETLRAQQILSSLTYSRHQLNTFHYPDGLKYLGNQITEHFTSNAAIQILKQNISSMRYQVEDNWSEEYVKEEVKMQEFMPPSPQRIESIDELESSPYEEDFQLEIFGLVWDEESLNY